MNRRSVVLVITAAVLMGPGSVIAQQPDGIPTVGVLITHVPLSDPFTESVRSSFRALGYYVDRLLKGSRASELPVEQVATFKLAVNQKTAKALGVIIPQSVMVRADEVIH
jgi:hypothetical protein